MWIGKIVEDWKDGEMENWNDGMGVLRQILISAGLFRRSQCNTVTKKGETHYCHTVILPYC